MCFLEISFLQPDPDGLDGSTCTPGLAWHVQLVPSEVVWKECPHPQYKHKCLYTALQQVFILIVSMQLEVSNRRYCRRICSET